ncbi:hypothetical protein NE237_003946 [Protea cynaroides]|uniref:Uncharacterized protein n=1 Tax=Protea cynaroides TaxID=273540 RepID=A0A9Q0KHY8_9MAGN|nr:hypothetical protein NE237_003946 [Protea cynaroides]
MVPEIREGSVGDYCSKSCINVLSLLKCNILQFSDLKDSKEAVYGALDAWVAWEQNFLIASLKQALFALEKEQQWHRVVQCGAAKETTSHILVECHPQGLLGWAAPKLVASQIQLMSRFDGG